jgi:hypothetical protein
VAQVREVEKPLVRRSVRADDSAPVDSEDDGEVLQADVVDDLIVGALKEGGVDRHHGDFPLPGKPRGEGDRVRLGDSDVEEPCRQGLAEFDQPRPAAHGRRDRHHVRILLSDFEDGGFEHLRVRGKGPFSLAFPRYGIECPHAVKTLRVGLRRRVSFSLRGHHVDEDGSLEVPQIQEGPHEIVNVVARDGPDIGEPEFLEEQPGDDEPLGELLGPFSEPGEQLPVGHRLEQRLDALSEGRIELSRHHPV